MKRLILQVSCFSADKNVKTGTKPLQTDEPQLF